MHDYYFPLFPKNSTVNSCLVFSFFKDSWGNFHYLKEATKHNKTEYRLQKLYIFLTKKYALQKLYIYCHDFFLWSFRYPSYASNTAALPLLVAPSLRIVLSQVQKLEIRMMANHLVRGFHPHDFDKKKLLPSFGPWKKKESMHCNYWNMNEIWIWMIIWSFLSFFFGMA